MAKKLHVKSQAERKLEALESRTETADERYQEIDLSTASLSDVKDAKMAQLEEACQVTILRGFDYTIDSTSYHFSCSLSAQANFQGTDTLFKDGTIADTEWTVVNNSTGKVERITLDQATFNAIKVEVFSHINSNVQRLRNVLQPQVESAETKSDVDSVAW